MIQRYSAPVPLDLVVMATRSFLSLWYHTHVTQTCTQTNTPSPRKKRTQTMFEWNESFRRIMNGLVTDSTSARGAKNGRKSESNDYFHLSIRSGNCFLRLIDKRPVRTSITSSQSHEVLKLLFFPFKIITVENL